MAPQMRRNKFLIKFNNFYQHIPARTKTCSTQLSISLNFLPSISDNATITISIPVLILCFLLFIASRSRLLIRLRPTALLEIFLLTIMPNLEISKLLFLVFRYKKFLLYPLPCSNTRSKSFFFVREFCLFIYFELSRLLPFRAKRIITFANAKILNSKSTSIYTVSFALAFARRRAKTLFPDFVLFLIKNPCARALFLFLG